MTTILMSEAQKFAAGLRELAAMYETYPGMPLPDWPSYYVNGASPQQMVEIAKAQGAQKTEKEYQGETFSLTKIFTGNVRVQYSISREQVCRKVVKEVLEVPETVEPEKIIPAKVIPAHRQEIIEWECHPLLAPPEPQRLEAVSQSELIEEEAIPF